MNGEAGRRGRAIAPRYNAAAMRSGTLIRGIVVFGAAYLLRLAYLAQIAKSPFFDFLQLDPLYYHDWAVAIAKGD